MAQRSLTPYGGSDPVMSLHREMNRLFDDVFRGGFGSRSFAPASQAAAAFDVQMDVSETDKEYRVSIDVPGVDQDDIDINLDGDLLTIRGEKKVEQKREDKANYHVIERSYGSFQRALRLPFAANPDEVRAECQNGVLTLTIPKSARQGRSRRIQIQGSPSQAIGQSQAPSSAGEQADEPAPGAEEARRSDDGPEATAH